MQRAYLFIIIIERDRLIFIKSLITKNVYVNAITKRKTRCGVSFKQISLLRFEMHEMRKCRNNIDDILHIYQIIKSDGVKRRNAIAIPLRGNARRLFPSLSRRFVRTWELSCAAIRRRNQTEFAKRQITRDDRESVTRRYLATRGDRWLTRLLDWVLRIVECSYPTHVPPHHVSLRRASAFRERRENIRFRNTTLLEYFSFFLSRIIPKTLYFLLIFDYII